jgi:hypothetical protein
VIDMADDRDDLDLTALRSDYGRDWTVGRTYCDSEPHWWKATRRRRLSDAELDRGLAETLIYDTAPLLRAALAGQVDLAARTTVTARNQTGP